MNGDLTYNTNGLQTFNPTTKVGIITNTILHTDIPDSVAELFAKANANDSNIPNDDYPSKKIALKGSIHGSTQADLDARIDAFKGIFTARYKNLDITYGSGTRRYVVMKANAVGIERQNKVLWASFSIELICKPFGFDTAVTSLVNSQNYTSTSPLTFTPTIGGNAPYQLPVFTITIDALTGAGDYVQITNNLNSQQMLIYGLGLVAGDVLVIDCTKQEVRRNGTKVNYYGTFLELEPGVANLSYSDGFTTKQVDIVGEYYKRWM